MEIVICINGRGKYRIQVFYWTTVADVKVRMEELSHVPVAWQVLWLNGLELKDDYNMEFYEIVEGMTIPLTVKFRTETRIQYSPILSKLSLQDINLKIIEETTTITVADLKEKIRDVTRIPVARIKTFFLDSEDTELEEYNVLCTPNFLKQILVKVEVIPS